MRNAWVIIPLLVSLVSAHAQDRTVLMAAHRAGSVEVLDPNTLHPLGSVKVLPLADGIASGSTGMMFLREGLAPDFKGCCALYALNLKTRNMTKLLSPTSAIVVSPDGEHVITQRGNVGIESFNGHTLQREPEVPRSIAPGMYGLCFSQNGHLLFGASTFPTPALDVIDFGQRKLLQHFALPKEFRVLGACAGNDYYLYGHDTTTHQLWRLKAGGSTMGSPVNIKFPTTNPEPDKARKCEVYAEKILVARNRVFLIELFGGKTDRRARGCREVPGWLLVGPHTGRVKGHFASELHFAQLISSADGKQLYGVDVRDAERPWSSVSVVLLDAATGRSLARRDMVPDVWFLTLATIPTELVLQGQLAAVTK